jgi:hypothetical protein
MTVPADILDKAEQVFDLERLFDRSPLNAALESVIPDLERLFRRKIAAEAVAFADGLEDRVDLTDDAFTIMDLFSRHLTEDNPAQVYVPADDDVIVVTLIGPVETYTDDCDHCGSGTESTWSVYDTRSGQEIHFPRKNTPVMDIRIVFKEPVPV